MKLPPAIRKAKSHATLAMPNSIGLAGPHNDRHNAAQAAAFKDYHDRIEDYFVQSNFGTADSVRKPTQHPNRAALLSTNTDDALPGRQVAHRWFVGDRVAGASPQACAVSCVVYGASAHSRAHHPRPIPAR